MSKFIEAVRTYPTYRERVGYEPLRMTCVGDNSQEIPNVNRMQEYLIGVDWRIRVSCDFKDMDRAMENVVRQLRDAVYGDMRVHLLKLQRAMFEWEQDEMRAEIDWMLKEMFD